MNQRKIILSLFTAFTFTSLFTHAQTFTVKKSKGRQAVIESSTPLVEGETYTIQTSKQSGLITEDVSYPRSNRSRENSFSAGITSSFFKADNLQEHEIDIEGRYGWNYGDYEVGPILHLNLLDQGAGFNTDYYIGGYFDYNLVPNVSRESMIYGVTAQVYAGNREFTNGSSSQITAFGAGGFLSYFLMGSSTALRFEGLVESKKIATSSSSANAIGFVGKMVFAFYY